jgi:DNA-binding protein H-NS
MNLNKLDVEALLNLRNEVETELQKRQHIIQTQLNSLSLKGRKSNGSHLKGVKVPPKYRGPEGEEWAGRGARPRWLVALVGKKGNAEKYRIKAT